MRSSCPSTESKIYSYLIRLLEGGWETKMILYCRALTGAETKSYRRAARAEAKVSGSIGTKPGFIPVGIKVVQVFGSPRHVSNAAACRVDAQILGKRQLQVRAMGLELHERRDTECLRNTRRHAHYFVAV